MAENIGAPYWSPLHLSLAPRLGARLRQEGQGGQGGRGGEGNEGNGGRGGGPLKLHLLWQKTLAPYWSPLHLSLALGQGGRGGRGERGPGVWACIGIKITFTVAENIGAPHWSPLHVSLAPRLGARLRQEARGARTAHGHRGQ